MAQWGKNDASSNSVLHAPTNVKLEPNTANRDNLYGNTSADAFVTNQTVGMFGVDDAEVTAAREGANPRPAHAGWVLRREGSGNRAGRVHYEVLVAQTDMTGDAGDDVTLPDVWITIDTQPTDASGNSSADDIVTFTTAATVNPSGSPIYQWQFANGQDLVDAGAYSNTTTATLSVLANTAPDATQYRCEITATADPTGVVTDTVTITVTS